MDFRVKAAMQQWQNYSDHWCRLVKNIFGETKILEEEKGGNN